MKIDYNIKSQIIESGLLQIYSQYSMAVYKLDKVISDKAYKPYIKGLQVLSRSFLITYLSNEIQILQNEAITRFRVDLTNDNDYLIKETKKLQKANYKRVKHLKAKISKMLNRPCLFLTLTFSDETLAKYPKKDSLHRFVKRYLERVGYQLNYCANVDYGTENGRIHYHAVIQADKIDPTLWHKRGAIKIEQITRKNHIALSKYLSKLTNHAIKETCLGNRIIYSRYKPDNSKSVSFNNLGLSKKVV